MTAPIGDRARRTTRSTARRRDPGLEGSEVAVSRSLAGLEPRRHARGHRHPPLRTIAGGADCGSAAERGAAIVAVTDSPLSPLVAGATETFFISAQGVGPFDSVTGGDRPGEPPLRRRGRPLAPKCARPPGRHRSGLVVGRRPGGRARRKRASGGRRPNRALAAGRGRRQRSRPWTHRTAPPVLRSPSGSRRVAPNLTKRPSGT